MPIDDRMMFLDKHRNDLEKGNFTRMQAARLAHRCSGAPEHRCDPFARDRIASLLMAGVISPDDLKKVAESGDKDIEKRQIAMGNLATSWQEVYQRMDDKAREME